MTAVIFGWIKTRVEQAIVEGFDPEDAARITGLSPSPDRTIRFGALLPAPCDETPFASEVDSGSSSPPEAESARKPENRFRQTENPTTKDGDGLATAGFSANC